MFDHAINQQVFDFTCKSEEVAKTVQLVIEHYTALQIKDIISTVLSEHPNQTHLKIDRMEIDLGDISLGDFGHTEMLERFKSLFSEKFSNLRNEKMVNDRINAGHFAGSTGKIENEWEILRSFLLYGDLPWWSDKNVDIGWDALLQKIINLHPDLLRSFFNEQKDTVSVLWRLSDQLKPATKGMIDALVPGFLPESRGRQIFERAGNRYSLSNTLLVKLKSLPVSNAHYAVDRRRDLLFSRLYALRNAMRRRSIGVISGSPAFNVLPGIQSKTRRRKSAGKVKDQLKSFIQRLSFYQVEFLLSQMNELADLNSFETRLQAVLHSSSKDASDTFAYDDDRERPAGIGNQDEGAVYVRQAHSGADDTNTTDTGNRPQGAEHNPVAETGATEPASKNERDELQSTFTTHEGEQVIFSAESGRGNIVETNVGLKSDDEGIAFLDGETGADEPAKSGQGDDAFEKDNRMQVFFADSEKDNWSFAGIAEWLAYLNDPTFMMESERPVFVPGLEIEKEGIESQDTSATEAPRDKWSESFDVDGMADREQVAEPAAAEDNTGIEPAQEKKRPSTINEPPHNSAYDIIQTLATSAPSRHRKIAFIMIRLNTSAPVLLNYLKQLNETELGRIEDIFKKHIHANKQRRKTIEAVLENPHFRKYNILKMYAGLYVDKHLEEKAAFNPAGTKPAGKKRRLMTAFAEKWQLSLYSFQFLVDKLSSKELMLLKDIFEKQNGEGGDEKKLLRKMLSRLPEDALLLVKFLTGLPENEIREIQSLMDDGPRADVRVDIEAPFTFLGNSGPQKIYIENAGLCLIALYLKGLFVRLGYLENGSFPNKWTAARALYLLQYIVTGKKKFPEYLLQLNKIFCGFGVEDYLISGIRLSKKEMTEADDLIQSVVEHWKALKNTSLQGFRESFLQRKGILLENEMYWTLQVERKGYDLLLNTIPWGFSMIKLPWMKKHMQVEW